MSNALMQIQKHSFVSRFLHREMEFLSCGEQGQPVLAFPTQNGHARQWVDFGMLEVLAPFIEEGRIQLFLADAIDEETISGGGSPHDRAMRLRHYTEYIADELIPVMGRSTKRSGSESRVIVSGLVGEPFMQPIYSFAGPICFDPSSPSVECTAPASSGGVTWLMSSISILLWIFCRI